MREDSANGKGDPELSLAVWVLRIGRDAIVTRKMPPASQTALPMLLEER